MTKQTFHVTVDSPYGTQAIEQFYQGIYTIRTIRKGSIRACWMFKHGM